MNTIRENRDKLGLTIRELANKIDVHFATISAWESERAFPRPKKLNALTVALGISKESLFPERFNKEDVPVAICGGPDNPLKIGDIAIQCYVLEGERRVLVQKELISALNMKYGTGGAGSVHSDRLANFINTNAIKPFVSSSLSGLITNPIKFKTTRGPLAYGYEATALADICDAVLESRKAGKLNVQQIHIAEQCEILMRGFARVGIIALVDEATGYQEIRSRDALNKILEKFIAKELRKWAKTFPDEFYKELFRLRGWQYIPFSVKRPGVVGKYTNDLVYERLAPGILEELKRKNPANTKGVRKHKHFQWLTEHVGHPRLREHLASLIVLMKASNNWPQFYRMLQKAVPRYGDQLFLNFKNIEE